MEDLKDYIREIPDFPKKGINFKDITTLLKEGPLFKKAVEQFRSRYNNKKIEVVVSVEARGFIFGAALAYALGAGIVPVRKKGKLPASTHRASYDLEYGSDTLEIHQDAIMSGQNVLIIDDLLATGGTTSAVCRLVEQLGGKIVEVAFLIELTFLNGRDRLKNYPVFSLIKY